MEARPTPLTATYPPGLPAAWAAGRVVGLRLYVPGEPIPQSRPRGRVREGKSGPYVQFYEEDKSSDYKDRIAEFVRYQSIKVPVEGDAGTFTLPLEDVRALLTVTFWFRKPPSYPKRVVDHTKKPDLDNLAKCVLDGLVRGMVLKDDNCVTDLVLQKRYVATEAEQGVTIDLTALPTETV